MEPEKLFAEEVTKAGKVWTLASDKGWAASASEDYEDAEVLPFWSAADKAAAAATENWKDMPHMPCLWLHFLKNGCLVCTVM